MGTESFLSHHLGQQPLFENASVQEMKSVMWSRWQGVAAIRQDESITVKLIQIDASMRAHFLCHPRTNFKPTYDGLQAVIFDLELQKGGYPCAVDGGGSWVAERSNCLRSWIGKLEPGLSMEPNGPEYIFWW